MDYILLVPACTNGHIGIGTCTLNVTIAMQKKGGGREKERGGEREEEREEKPCLFKNNNNTSIKLQAAHHM